MATRQGLNVLAERISTYLLYRFQYELRQQGHVLTGALVESLEAQYEETAKGFILRFLANDYGGVLNNGIEPQNVPFREGSGVKTSKVVQGLIGYVEKRMGLKGKRALGVAFAILKKWKKEGMPTQNSYKFSRNGRRKYWIDTVEKDSQDAIREYVESFIEEEIKILFTNYITNQ